MIYDELNTALAKWLEITDCESSKLADFHYFMSVEELDEAQQLDHTGVTTAMVLQSLWDEFSTSIKVSVHDIIKEKPEVLQKIGLYKELQRLLHTPAINEEVIKFQQQMVDVLKFYLRDDSADAIRMASDRGVLGLLRRDALRSMNKFSAYQFVQGKAGVTTTQIRYASMIYRFDNMQSLVSSMIANKEPGIALCHILDQNGLEFSYFAFSIWDGGTLTIVTDKTKYAHPLQKQMSRNPTRALLKRWGEHHFPYELLNAEFHDNKSVVFKQKQGLVAYNTKATKIAEIWKLEPDVIIWLMMIFEQLHQKYFIENHRLPELSYTGDIVQKQVPVSNYLTQLGGWVPPVVPVFSSDDLTPTKTADNWEVPTTGFNEWLEDRYRQHVPSALLNLVSDGQKLLPAPITDDTSIRIYEAVKDDLIAPSPHDFGTSSQLKADSEFVARYNQSKIIQHLATEEFENRQDEIMKWYNDRILANRDFLINAACNMELILPTVDSEAFSSKMTTKNTNVLNIIYNKNGHCRLTGFYGALVGELRRINGGKWYCAISPSILANMFASIKVNNPQAISIVTGVPVDDLPDVLQHYYLCDPYYGNNILDRVDPMEWVVENPWCKLGLDIRIVLSRKCFKERRKSLRLPEFANWEVIER